MSSCGVYPTRMEGVAWGQPPPAFNDVYLARLRSEKGRCCVWLTDWQMFKMREGTHEADNVTTERSMNEEARPAPRV